MAAITFAHPARAWLRRAWLFLLIVPLAGAAACWWLTVPLDDDASVERPGPQNSVAPAPKTAVPGVPEGGAQAGTLAAAADWPEGRLEGNAAKRLLLDTMLAVQGRLKNVAGYTATFRKQERIDGVLGPEQTMAMKIRHHPFAIYLKYLSPNAGKEVVYAEGHHDNKIIAHSGGVARFLVPRLAVLPDHPLALADTRHSITEAGLANLTDRLLSFRRLDLDDPDAATILDRATDANGRPWLRSLHTHPHYDGRRPFARVEILYDPETRLPLRIDNYDWPAPGHEGDLLLAERYIYEDVDLGAVLTGLDFDPANPAYAFHRY
jgi:hypothetical protein